MAIESAEPAAAVEPEKAVVEGEEAPAAEGEETTAAAEEAAPVEEVKVSLP